MAHWLRNILTTLWLVLVAMAGYLVLNLGPELLGGDIENRLRARLGDDYFPVVLGVFLVAVTATVLQGRRWWKKQKTTSATTLAAPDVL
ncbi:MAG TPA: hypothetical protein DCR93_26485, partial [Cytophagales bacterium]|nr:hypothetical protein [Cytophagales bacterium]